MDISELVRQVGVSTFALLAITNPFGILPVFISMTDDLTDETRDKLFQLVVFTAAIIVAIFALMGTIIMQNVFQVELSDLRIAGGILLLAMGTKNLLYPQETKEHDTLPAASNYQSRIVPMAFPLLVGPGALSTIIIIDNEMGKLVAFVSILISFTIIFLLFKRTKLIERLVNKLILFILSRVMQVFIMAIGAKMLITGLLTVFPALGK